VSDVSQPIGIGISLCAATPGRSAVDHPRRPADDGSFFFVSTLAAATWTDEEHTATLNSFLLFFGDDRRSDREACPGDEPQERLRSLSGGPQDDVALAARREGRAEVQNKWQRRCRPAASISRID
jgi:hypothetical protein